ncbi:hypothetical protein [Streptomyces sp. SAI-090]|jgi:hypothetical protein|uniref:hypothetical protein n=1 Tax=Streptomyces sp. SAI-090 TaxID=2940545 RepID=UPI002475353B|nr:hypothetical protein [Streptomyces sp. SAI-090]MDH6522292.1 hypothetical protein [Streptomyces sp. SAI-090]
MDGRRRSGAFCVRLVLFATLLFGIVGMHTMGHPEGAASGTDMVRIAQTDAAGTGRAPSMASVAGPTAASVEIAEAVGAAAAHAASDLAAHGMDPAMVCLAVLSVWAIALLAAAFPAGPWAVVPFPLRFRVLSAVPPVPPVGLGIARLSVLRA